jgi:hypothetical protein
VERLSQAVAGGSILATLLLLHFVMGRPLLAALLAGMVAAVLLQHALVGRSLLLPLYRGLGFRTVSCKSRVSKRLNRAIFRLAIC